jgi:hypothetical protein
MVKIISSARLGGIWVNLFFLFKQSVIGYTCLSEITVFDAHRTRKAENKIEVRHILRPGSGHAFGKKKFVLLIFSF